jgi:hypothetical protein
MRWVSDLTNKEIGDEITRLCKMADLQLPELPKETAEFIKDEFSRYESTIIRMAIDHWIGGNIAITAYAKVNANFLSKVIKAYIDQYRHKLKLKPKKVLEPQKVEQKILTEEDIRDSCLNTIALGRRAWVSAVERADKGNFITYPYIMIIYSALEKLQLLPEDVDDREVMREGEKYKNYRKRTDMEALRAAENEVKRKSIMKIIERAGDANINFYKVGLVGMYYKQNP